MGQNLSRREFLVSSLGAAGVLAAGGLLRAETAEKVYYPSVKSAGGAPHLPSRHRALPHLRSGRVARKTRHGFRPVGGLKKLVSNKTVSIKINVTGGPGKLAGLPGYRTYQIHPNLLAACVPRWTTPARGG